MNAQEDYTYFGAELIQMLVEELRKEEQMQYHSEPIPYPSQQAIQQISGIIQSIRGSGYYSDDVRVQSLHVLYEIVQQHPLGNGNKRVALFLFLAYCLRYGTGQIVVKSGDILKNLCIEIAKSNAQGISKEKVIERLGKEIIFSSYRLSGGLVIVRSSRPTHRRRH